MILSEGTKEVILKQPIRNSETLKIDANPLQCFSCSLLGAVILDVSSSTFFIMAYIYRIIYPWVPCTQELERKRSFKN